MKRKINVKRTIKNLHLQFNTPTSPLPDDANRDMMHPSPSILISQLHSYYAYTKLLNDNKYNTFA